MKRILLLISLMSLSAFGKEKFSDAEVNFKLAMDKLLQEYLEEGIKKEDLYQAATAGMLSSLNGPNQEWNSLLDPSEVRELQVDISGKVTGIGVTMKFDPASGYARVLNVIPRSPAEKSGLRPDDQILTVDGEKFKGKEFLDMVQAIRGKIGESTKLKVLRDDKIITFNVKREIIPWTPIELSRINPVTQILSIGYFTNETSKLVEEKIKIFNASGANHLIVDLRGNAGGGFENAIQTAELFIPKDHPIASTKGRGGERKIYVSKRGILKPNIKLVILADKETSSGAELLAGALRDEFKAKIVGQGTLGKWNVQTLQTLSNGFAIKYSVLSFQTPSGQSYQGTGLKADVLVALPQDVTPREIEAKYKFPQRLEFDPQLRAAVELM